MRTNPVIQNKAPPKQEGLWKVGVGRIFYCTLRSAFTQQDQHALAVIIESGATLFG